MCLGCEKNELSAKWQSCQQIVTFNYAENCGKNLPNVKMGFINELLIWKFKIQHYIIVSKNFGNLHTKMFVDKGGIHSRFLSTNTILWCRQLVWDTLSGIGHTMSMSPFSSASLRQPCSFQYMLKIWLVLGYGTQIIHYWT